MNAVCNTIIDVNERFEIDSKDNFIGISSFCFDLSVYDIFGSISVGATLVLIPDARDISYIVDTVTKENIIVWNTVPAIMELLLDSLNDYYSNTSLKNVFLSGDWIPLDLKDKICDYFTNARVMSLGGATEASIWSIYTGILYLIRLYMY
ncbi:AMP-binding protein [Aceticella autotrophica]|uniref:AMP-binding protein n=1 Tax=Aceticella autotrophica TaxID=2755338 RepID=A0A975AW83_9THEO|nr:AMP-binding protein [Aceticella autotrophica]